MKKACITGITGQTGSYLAELLLDEGYEVHGLVRRSSSFSTGRIEHIYDRVKLTYGDLADYSSLTSWIGDTKPDLLFNMASPLVEEFISILAHHSKLVICKEHRPIRVVTEGVDVRG